MSGWEAKRGCGVALYEFEPAGDYQVALGVGDQVEIYEESQGWYKGVVLTEPTQSGIFPASYVSFEAIVDEEFDDEQPVESAPDAAGKDASAASTSDSTATTETATSSASPTADVSIAASERATEAAQSSQMHAVSAYNAASPAASLAARRKPAPPSGPRPSQGQSKVTSDTKTTTASAATAATTTTATTTKPAPPKSASRSTRGSASVEVVSGADSKADGMRDMSVDALLGEIRQCISEWSNSLNSHMLNGNTSEYHKVKDRISQLLELRSKLMGASDATSRESVRARIIKMIESSRRMQEGFMVPRNADGDLADDSNTNIMELLELHRTMYGVLKEEAAAPARRTAARRRQDSIFTQRDALPAYEKGKSPLPPGNLQLFLDVQMCIYKVTEPTELFFSLYSEEQKAFITEPYVVCLTDQGMPEDLSLLGKLFTLFKDLSAADFKGGLHLVCYIYRRGRLVLDKKSDGMYRRQFGCGVINLTQIFADNPVDTPVSPPPAVIYVPRSEAQFPTLHQLVIAGERLEIAPQAKGIILQLALYPGDETAIRTANPKLTVHDAPTTPKINFPDVVNPTEVRNDFYVFLLNGNFNQGRKTAAKNIQIVMEVCDDIGRTIPNAISMGSGHAAKPVSEFKSSICYHNNDPQLNEVIRLNIAPEVFEKCHLLLKFWHCSTSAKKSAPFAFGFLKLTTPSGAVISDAEHDITSYKMTKELEDRKNNAFYLAGQSSSRKLEVRKEEVFRVRTKLASTKQTQNNVLYNIFKWKNIETNTLRHFLDQLAAMRGSAASELARFSRELFNALFGILVTQTNVEVCEAAFRGLLNTIGVLTDKKIKIYRTVADTYIDSLFNEPRAHKKLAELGAKNLAECKGQPDASVMTLARCLGYIMRFIVKSWKVDKEQGSTASSEEEFRASIMTMLAHTNTLVSLDESKDARYLFPTQTQLIRGFPQLVEDISDAFSSEQLGLIVREFLQAIPSTDNHSLNKLNLVRLLLHSKFGEVEQCRKIIFPVLISIVKHHMGSIERTGLGEPYLCIAILRRLLKQMCPMSSLSSTSNAEVMWDFRSILSELVSVVDLIQQSTLGQVTLRKPPDTVTQYCKVDLLPDSTSVLWTVFHGLLGSSLDRFMEETSNDELAAVMEKLLIVAKRSLSLLYFPDLWIVMNMLEVNIVCRLLTSFCDPLCSRFGPNSGSFKVALWQQFFSLGIALLSTDKLNLESFTAQKRDFVSERHGDMRSSVVKHFKAAWESLGASKVRFVGHLVADLFEISLSTTFDEAHKLAADVYYDMVSTEFAESKQFNEVERHTIDALYNMTNMSQEQSKTFMDSFFSDMSARVGSDTALGTAGSKFVTHISRMYELMSSLLNFPDTARFEDERTSVALKLMNYLEESGHQRKEMSSRYIQFLVDLHVGLGNFVEAGVCQLLQIRLMEWSMDPMEASSLYPAEPECERKVRMYRQAISYFVQGEAWERAIEQCENLRSYYQNDAYDFVRLAELLEEQATFCRSIATTDRFYPNYFRVCFYGSFDDQLNGQEFVFRGIRLEPIMDFTNRIKQKYPSAHILMSSDTPSDELVAEKKQVISITTLTKEKQDSAMVLSDNKSSSSIPPSLIGRELPGNMEMYHLNNDLCVFSYSKGVQKSTEKHPANEFKTLWVTKSYIQTKESFPTTRRRCRVVKRREVSLSPVHNAASTVGDKNNELLKHIENVEKDTSDHPDVSPLSMNLNGMIDAAVNGGTQKYIEAFLSPTFLSENPGDENAEQQRLLKQYLNDQLVLLKRGLALFGERCDPALQGLYEHLMTKYSDMVQTVTKAIE
jgi:C2 domain in Dock180 and Zizimin proteins/DOCK N-terminus/DHR-2, Lobe C/DHR-2, Lobe A/SH3 domain